MLDFSRVYVFMLCLVSANLIFVFDHSSGFAVCLTLFSLPMNKYILLDFTSVTVYLITSTYTSIQHDKTIKLQISVI